MQIEVEYRGGWIMPFKQSRGLSEGICRPYDLHLIARQSRGQILGKKIIVVHDEDRHIVGL